MRQDNSDIGACFAAGLGPIKLGQRVSFNLRRTGMTPDEPRPKSADRRRARLAASLRENLKRRKAQNRARQVEAQPPDGPTARTPGEPAS
jgi:hypothetical protein